jgi:hypothetical protein
MGNVALLLMPSADRFFPGMKQEQLGAGFEYVRQRFQDTEVLSYQRDKVRSGTFRFDHTLIVGGKCASGQ